jgi:hypothetical protein
MKSAHNHHADCLNSVQQNEGLTGIVGIESLLPNDLKKKLRDSVKTNKPQGVKLVPGHLEAKRIAWHHF